jgi:hypothetical protein
MKRLIFGLMILASILTGCVVESELDTEEQAMEQPDGIPQNPNPEPPPLPLPQCDDGPHCCPDPRDCKPTLPK